MFRFALAIFTLALPLAAQQGILGSVTDASGAAVPGAPGADVAGVPARDSVRLFSFSYADSRSTACSYCPYIP